MIKRPLMWFWISLITIVVSVVIIVAIGPLWGIDFTGGTLIELKLLPEADPTAARAKAEEIVRGLNLPALVQTTTDDTILLRTSAIPTETHELLVSKLREEKLIDEELRFETIGPTIGQELRRKSIWAAVLALAVIVIYLAYTFRQTGGLIASWKFGVSAAYALLHDVVVITAFFVILGKLYHVAIDTMFVSAMLAIAGYSINDTIVVFSRIKEEWLSGHRRSNFKDIMNKSVAATFIRSLNTSLATVLVLLALIVFGGSTLRWFLVALIAGIATGTYSSIYVASPCLYFLSRERT